MNKTFLPLLLAATLGTSPAYAFDSSDPFGMSDAQAEKPAKAVREKNDGRFLETMAKSFGTGVGVGAAGVAAMGVTALPLLAVVGPIFIGEKMRISSSAKVNAFYSGTVVRGKVTRTFHYKRKFYEKELGISLDTVPSQPVLDDRITAAILDLDGPSNAVVFAFFNNGTALEVGDIVDVKSPMGIFTDNASVIENLHFDFNKHAPRAIGIYCKHDNPSCQNDFESSLGVIARHQDKEFPPSQYLIDPAIIAADQARMRMEEEERKAASNSGGFNFM